MVNLNPMYEGIPFSPPTMLTQPISDIAVSIEVEDVSVFPASPGLATLGVDENAETILYAGIVGDTLTGITRAAEGTAKAWAAGTTIARNFTWRDHETLQGNITELKRAVENDVIPMTQRGAINGVATLSGGKIPPGQVPDMGWVESVDTAPTEMLIAVDNTDTDNPKVGATPLLVGVVEEVAGYTDPEILGVEADFANNIFRRLAGAIGRTPGAGFNDVPMYGQRRRCCVADNGTILAYHGEPGYTETGKLTQAVNVGGTNYPIGTNAQVMVYQPKFYYRMAPRVLEPQSDGQGFHIRKARYYISESPKTGFKVHPAFIRQGIEKPYILIGAYEACLQKGANYLLADEQTGNFTAGTGDKLSSIANAKPASGLTQQLTRPNTQIVAANRGAGWSQITIQAISAVQLLFAVEYCTFNTQSAIGLGVVNKPDVPNTANNSELTGATASLGNNTGMAAGTDGLVSISYRGQENWWGNIWEFVNGINVWGDGALKGGVPYIADHGFVEDINTAPYQSAAFTTVNIGNPYVSAFGYGNPDYDWLFLCSEGVGGNSVLPIGDAHWATVNLNGYRIALFGASWNHGLQAGGFCWSLGNASSLRARTIGGRALYAP